MPEVPRSIETALQNVRSTMRLRWNPKAKLLKAGSYSVLGEFTPPEYDGRWELWDTDSEGADYKILRIEHPDGSFKPLGQWLVDKIRFINPERWDGDPNKMLAALIDMEQERKEEMMDADFEALADASARWGAWVQTPKSYNPANTKQGQWSAPKGRDTAENNFDALAAGATPAKPGSKILTP